MAELTKANINLTVPKKKVQNMKRTSSKKTMLKVGDKLTTTFQKMTPIVENVVISYGKLEKTSKNRKAAAVVIPKNTIKGKFVSKLPYNVVVVRPKKIVPREVTTVSDAKKLSKPKKRVSILTVNKTTISLPKRNGPQQRGDEPKPANSRSIKVKRMVKKKPLLKSSVNGKTSESKSAEKSGPSDGVVHVTPAIDTVESPSNMTRYQ